MSEYEFRRGLAEAFPDPDIDEPLVDPSDPALYETTEETYAYFTAKHREEASGSDASSADLPK